MYLLEPLLSNLGRPSALSDSSFTLPSSSNVSLLPCSLPSVFRASSFLLFSSCWYLPSMKLCTEVSSTGG
jgi:hypothetical protein